MAVLNLWHCVIVIVLVCKLALLRMPTAARWRFAVARALLATPAALYLLDPLMHRAALPAALCALPVAILRLVAALARYHWYLVLRRAALVVPSPLVSAQAIVARAAVPQWRLAPARADPVARQLCKLVTRGLAAVQVALSNSALELAPAPQAAVLVSVVARASLVAR